MLIFEEKIQLDKALFQLTDVPAEKILYFDIETTGFSPVTCGLYLIGCVFLKDNDYYIRQWFADTANSEKDIILSFLDFVKNFSVLVHYNGTGFDIPFIIKKCDLYHIPCDFSGIESFDIYKKISPLKAIFNIDNLKQKSIETFLGINREDKYSGGELINVYIEYLKRNDTSLRKLLLLHNHDDILGMVQILPIINYTCLINKGFNLVSISEKDKLTTQNEAKKEIHFEIALEGFLPKRISIGNDLVYFTACANTAKLTIESYNSELKYFYSNYKDYYYLPDEDKSIHKSVAFFVDKNFRTKAKAANCYSKKTGVFLPQYGDQIAPYFKIDYYDKMTYIEFTEEFKNNTDLVNAYIDGILSKLLSSNVK